MPCNDGRPINWDCKCSYYSAEVSRLERQNEELIQRNDKLAQMLCSTCKFVEQSTLLRHLSKETQDWWQEHKKWDEERMQKELVVSALGKLTPEEQDALGKKLNIDWSLLSK